MRKFRLIVRKVKRWTRSESSQRILVPVQWQSQAGITRMRRNWPALRVRRPDFGCLQSNQISSGVQSKHT